MPATKAPKKPSRAVSKSTTAAREAATRRLIAEAPGLKMLDDRVMLRVDEAEQVTPGGILLPESAKEKPCRGTLVAVGPGKLNLKNGQRDMGDLKPGDRVLYGRYAGVEVPGHPNYRIMRVDDVLCTNA